MEKVYINIRNRRKELNMSQDKLAELVGYTDRSSIAKLESGKIDISLGMLQKLAHALNVTPMQLLDYWWED